MASTLFHSRSAGPAGYCYWVVSFPFVVQVCTCDLGLLPAGKMPSPELFSRWTIKYVCTDRRCSAYALRVNTEL